MDNVRVKLYDTSTTSSNYVPTRCLWETVEQYKKMKDYYETHHFDNRPSDEEIRERIRYVFENKVAQRDEIATLYWVLGERDERKF